eukprot:scaffold7.g3746.t1
MAAPEAAVPGGGVEDAQLFTRGGPNMPDNRGQSMVAKHLEKQQKEKENKAMEKLKLLAPQLGPAVRAMALQECDWSEDKAVVMLRRFQVGTVEELLKLQKERKKHQLGLDTAKPGGKKERKGKKAASSGSNSGSGSGSDAGESGSGSSGGSSSESESEEDEKRRSKRSKRKRSRSRSRSRERSSKRGRKERRRGGSRDRSKRRKDKRRKEKEKDKKRRRDKDKARAKASSKGAIGQEYGKYGIIRETDMYAKRPEFQLWAMEVKKVDLEAMPRLEEKELFKDYMEEYNTATLPHRKYYDLEVYERARAAKAARKGAYDELKTTDKAKAMREQELLRAQMTLAYRTGDTKKAERASGWIVARAQQAASSLQSPALRKLMAAAAANRAQAAAADTLPTSSSGTHKMGTLLIKCTDTKGVVAAVAQLLYGESRLEAARVAPPGGPGRFGCNITASDQFSDLEQGMFYQRVQFDYSDMLVGPGNAAVLERGIAEVARRYDMDWQVAYQDQQKRVAILVSKLSHGLYDLLIRREEGELNCQASVETWSGLVLQLGTMRHAPFRKRNCLQNQRVECGSGIPLIISNHPDLEPVAQRFGVPFVHLPIAKGDPGAKAAQEAEIERLLAEHDVNLIVLARYMQARAIFSPEFCEKHWRHTINIHHSFLPAFEGARPYHRRDVARVTHQDSVADMIRKGCDLERLVLARAVRWHIQDRIIVNANKTVVFEG